MAENVILLNCDNNDALEIAERRKGFSDAFLTLEDPIRDIRDMARIAAQEFGKLNISGDPAEATASFAVYHLEKMASALYETYVAMGDSCAKQS